MGQIRIVLSNNLEKKFRRKAMKKFGYRRGSLSKGMEEAVKNWLKK
ncbi:MAG: hypothetical protein QMD14_05955 [Candidatus Aenigmarchaeota archaeon]|nr:hypothetical protein [Candidatus Aenigmarchaeota archaeon]